MREKVGKSRNTVFFQWFGAPEGRKVGSLKLRVRSQLARWEMKNCTPLWREAHFQVKTYKTPGARSTFGAWDVEKVHVVVARSTFPSQNVQNTSRCGPLLALEMSKNWTPLWREAHFQVKMLKTLGVRSTFGGSDVEKVHAVVARSTFRSQNVKSTRGSDHFWRFRCPFASLHYTTLHYTTLHYTTWHYTPQHYNYNYTTTHLHSTTLQLQLHNYTPLHSTTLHYTKLHYITLHYITLHYTPLHYITLHYLPLHFTTLHYTTLHYNYNYTPLHSTTLNYTTLHSTTLHYITLHYTTFHYTSLHYTTLHYTTTTTTQVHSTTLHYTTLHYITLHYTPLHYTTLHYTEWHCTTDRQVDR